MLKIKEDDWNPVVHKDGTVSDTQWNARTLHAMNDTHQAFCLVVQRTHIKANQQDNNKDSVEKPNPTTKKLNEDSLPPHDEESVIVGQYGYRVIATNMDERGFTDDEIVRWYNQRVDSRNSRNSKDPIRFTTACLPCGDFDANALYLQLCATAFNLLALIRVEYSGRDTSETQSSF